MIDVRRARVFINVYRVCREGRNSRELAALAVLLLGEDKFHLIHREAG